MTPGRKGRVQQSDCWGQGEVGGGIGEEEANRRRRREKRSWVQNIQDTWSQHMEITLCNHASQVTAQWKEMARKWESWENVKLFSFEMWRTERRIQRQGFTWKKTNVTNNGMFMCVLFPIWLMIYCVYTIRSWTWLVRYPLAIIIFMGILADYCRSRM